MCDFCRNISQHSENTTFKRNGFFYILITGMNKYHYIEAHFFPNNIFNSLFFLHFLFAFTILIVKDSTFKIVLLVNQKQDQKYCSFKETDFMNTIRN